MCKVGSLEASRGMANLEMRLTSLPGMGSFVESDVVLSCLSYPQRVVSV
jgi:hypothetical protein